jgi:hypothetical protein
MCLPVQFMSDVEPVLRVVHPAMHDRQLMDDLSVIVT